MEWVPLEELKALAASSSSMFEVEKTRDINYKQFKTEYAKVYNAALSKYSKRKTQSAMDSLLKGVFASLKKSWLKKNAPPIEFIAEGSSRAAFRCGGGKCLKIAKNAAGIAQNKQEVKNIGRNEKTSKYECFVKNYDYDAKTKCSLLTECCAKIKSKDFEKLFGLTCVELGVEIGQILDLCDMFKKLDLIQAEKFYKKKWLQAQKEKDTFWMQELEQKLELIDNIKKNKAPQWEILRELVRFYQDNGTKSLLHGDLEDPDNWGYAIRYGKIVPIIIDAGFSEKVYQDYY